MRMRKEYLGMILIKGVVKVDKKSKWKIFGDGESTMRIEKELNQHYENRKRT
jgi:hypothetical protein